MEHRQGGKFPSGVFRKPVFMVCSILVGIGKGGWLGGGGVRVCEDTGIVLVIYVDYTIVLVGYMVKED